MTLYRGTLLAFDDGSYRARVRLDGSTPRTVGDVRCTRLEDGAFVAGRRVLVDTGDHNDPADIVVIAVWV